MEQQNSGVSFHCSVSKRSTKTNNAVFLLFYFHCGSLQSGTVGMVLRHEKCNIKVSSVCPPNSTCFFCSRVEFSVLVKLSRKITRVDLPRYSVYQKLVTNFFCSRVEFSLLEKLSQHCYRHQISTYYSILKLSSQILIDNNFDNEYRSSQRAII